MTSPFGQLEDLRARPIPSQATAVARKNGYRRGYLDLSDGRAKEPLVDICALGLAGRNHYAAEINAPYYTKIPGAISELLVRSGVGRKLVAANARLEEAGLQLFVFDAWRPAAVQRFFHDVWMPDALRRDRPDLTGQALSREVEMYWAAPTIDGSSPSPHATGGVIDLTLRWKGCQELLWMGSLFDEASGLAHLDHFEQQMANDRLSFSNEEARANRRLLYWVMTEVGFAANPHEWWHFGYGDLMWHALTQSPHAFYGAIES